MKNEYDLKQIYVIDSMHDERINQIEVVDNALVFHYDNLEHHNEYHSCKVIFIGGQDTFVEVRKREEDKTYSTIYDIEEFMRFIKGKHCVVETIDYYCGYANILIKGALVNSEGYCEHCIFSISATELIYQWA
jgi:hypothetical protein